MKSAFPILAAVALLLGASTAQAARPMGNSNIILAPTPPLQNSPPPTTNLGALNLPPEPRRPRCSRSGELRRAARQPWIGHLQSKRCPAYVGQLGFSDFA